MNNIIKKENYRLMCNECYYMFDFNISMEFDSNIRRILDTDLNGNFKCICPNCKKDTNFDIIDAQMADTIYLLNPEYKTDFCCQGHISINDEGEINSTLPYISFENGPEITEELLQKYIDVGVSHIRITDHLTTIKRYDIQYNDEDRKAVIGKTNYAIYYQSDYCSDKIIKYINSDYNDNAEGLRRLKYDELTKKIQNDYSEFCEKIYSLFESIICSVNDNEPEEEAKEINEVLVSLDESEYINYSEI